MTLPGRAPRAFGRRRTATPRLRRASSLLVALALALTGLVAGAGATPATAATNAEVEVFLAELADGAKQSWYQFGVPASVTLAQAALETGWGSSTLSSQYNNYFGIKCNKTNPSPYQSGCVDLLTTEYDSSGRPYQIIDSFRTYSSVANSMLDHGYYLKTRGLYTRAFPKNEDPCQFAIEVRRGGYATDPGYATYLIGMMRQRNMFRFDWRSGVGPAPCDENTNLTAAVLGGPVEADPLLPNTPVEVLAQRVGLQPQSEDSPTTAPSTSAPASTGPPTSSSPPTTVAPTSAAPTAAPATTVDPATTPASVPATTSQAQSPSSAPDQTAPPTGLEGAGEAAADPAAVVTLAATLPRALPDTGR